VSLVPHVVGADTVEREPEAVSVARALACTAAIREGAHPAHAELVAALAAQTAERMGLPADAVLRCRLGGWLHDLGKVANPDHILQKPGPLDDGEWAVMRAHPAAGEQIVAGVAALRDASAAVRHHHERLDGTGYPDRLAGTAIPIEARIVAAADAYAAMTSARVYSAARSPQQAAVELRRSAGSHLDTAVVGALLDVLGLAVAPALRVA
jgi:HD-GYP domain-containing protein (c-di-GMP phosphodiesterase class II)